jgi:hypothetical protein
MSAPRRKAGGARDQDRTGFTEALERSLEAPGVRGAVLVDDNGEAVDSAGRLVAFEAKVAAAHLQLLLTEATARLDALIGPVRELVVRADRASFSAHALPDGYAVALLLARHACAVSPLAVAELRDAVSREAGWTPRAARLDWRRVQVRTASHDRRRPVSLRVGQAWQPLELLGRDVAASCWRVRIPCGAEATILRERGGAWWSDEPLGDLLPTSPDDLAGTPAPPGTNSTEPC